MSEAPIRVTIPEEQVLLVERHHFVMTGLSALLTQFTYKSEFPIDADRYDQLLGEYLEAFAAREIAMRRVFAVYLPEQYGGPEYDKEILFETNEVVITRKGECHEGTCKCHH